MTEFSIYQISTGEVVRYGSSNVPLSTVVVASGEGIVEGEFPCDTYYISDGVPVKYTPEQEAAKAQITGFLSQWSNTTMQWVDTRTLEDLKTSAKLRINSLRLQTNQTSFSYLGKDIATDPLSRSDIDAINGEVNNTGAFPAGWPGGWKCIDNTYVALTTVTQWKAFYTAMVNQGSINFAHAQDLKATITAATTAEAVLAVTW